ncbi:hypothetical protein [Kutzneria sp. CA-103260]|uniref:hypothetical protein n=1 Tax=Kutzneria sp. CA-103260 TaxID=2802641 RepID=UPI002010FD62|nr:hypothetical protein [Kutzneria sp. CA-103260]
MPEIVGAQRRHLNLLRRHRRRQVTAAHAEASEICRRRQECRDHQQHIQRRIRTFTTDRLHDDATPPNVVHAAAYPEIVDLNSLLAADYWRAYLQDPPMMTNATNSHQKARKI